MTTVGSPRTVPGPGADGGGPGERLRRLERRRRLLREELLVVLILLFALAATVVVLALQWLGSGASATGAGAPPAAHSHFGGSA